MALNKHKEYEHSEKTKEMCRRSCQRIREENGRRKLRAENSPTRRTETGSQRNRFGCLQKCARSGALSVGSERNESHEASHLLSDHHQLHRLDDEMKLRSLLCLPKSHRRKQSKARSELGVGPSEGRNEVVSRPTESAPDLRIGTPTLPTSSPLAVRDLESNGK